MIDPKVRAGHSSTPSTQAKTLAEPQASAKRMPARAASEEEIRNCAYELYERRGGTEDRAVEDWLAAETQLEKHKDGAIAR